MKKQFALVAAIVAAVAIGFVGPTWAVPVVEGITEVARYMLETNMVMILDGQSMRFGCL